MVVVCTTLGSRLITPVTTLGSCECPAASLFGVVFNAPHTPHGPFSNVASHCAFPICKSMLDVAADMQLLQASFECFARNSVEMLLQSPHFTAVIEGKKLCDL